MKHYIFDVDDTLLLHRNDIHYEWLREDPELSYHLSQCPYAKHIFSNGNNKHVSTVLDTMNISQFCSLIVSRDNFGLKPKLETMSRMNQAVHRYDAATSPSQETPEIWFFDDRKENLEAGKIFGWTTVWIHTHATHYKSDHIVDYGFQDIKQALRELERMSSVKI
jgi:FMN phosphatase YigB (HAD superfamily)